MIGKIPSTATPTLHFVNTKRSSRGFWRISKLLQIFRCYAVVVVLKVVDSAGPSEQEEWPTYTDLTPRT